MSDLLLPVFIALLAWWLSTGVILFLNHLRRQTFRWSMLGATALLAGSLYGLHVSSMDSTPVGALLAFSQALVVWAWVEMSYFMGFVTGPRKQACPEGLGGWRRFRLALDTSLHHELVVILLGGVILWLTWDTPNRFGIWTYAILWIMRWSAKLNLFLGVPNV
jgi:putative photosynthetic complex assembly protein 2